MYFVVQHPLRPEGVHPRSHVRVIVIKADAKGCEGEVAVEVSDAFSEMS